MKKIVFIESGEGNPNNIKRIEEFVEHGYVVNVYSFERGGAVKNKPRGVEVIPIGAYSSDSSYLSRLGTIRRGIRNVLRRHKKDECIFYLFRNDMALAFTLLSRRPYIFEEADMTHLNLGNALLRDIMERQVRRIIRRSVMSVFRSEGFLKYHFGENRPNNVYVIPNRLHPDVMNLPSVASSIPNMEELHFAFVGAIRYRSVYLFAETILKRFPQHHFHFFGNFATKDIEERFIWLAQYDRCHFHGPFRSPYDLPEIYGQFDLLVSTYDVSSINVRYAEPNKLYEALYFERPIIVSTGTFLADKVNRLGAGYDVNAMSEEDVVQFVRGLTAESISQRIISIQKMEKQILINRNDAFFESLKRQIGTHVWQGADIQSCSGGGQIINSLAASCKQIVIPAAFTERRAA